MNRKSRRYSCPVVSEEVMIRLRRSSGWGRKSGYFVQCDQSECQYVDENVPPCPLHLGIFADEIRSRDEEREAGRLGL